MFIFSALLAFRNKAYYISFYSKKMAVSLNGLYNINYAVIFTFFKIIVLPNVIPDFFWDICIFFRDKKYYFLLFYKIIKVALKFYGIKNNNLLLLIFKTVYFRSF